MLTSLCSRCYLLSMERALHFLGTCATAVGMNFSSLHSLRVWTVRERTGPMVHCLGRSSSGRHPWLKTWKGVYTQKENERLPIFSYLLDQVGPWADAGPSWPSDLLRPS